jgi:hypothetical protein
MNKNSVERHVRVIGHLRTLFAIWFFAGMPLSMVLSGLSFVVGVPFPGLLFFLSSMIYLSGSLLGGLWSGENLRRQELSRADRVGTLLVLVASVGFLCLGIIFAVVGFRRL